METKLKNNYLCPCCKSYLKVWNNIIFSVKSYKDSKRGILLLNPELGNYSVISHASLVFDEGEIVEFFCPVCQADLTAKDININLVRILMLDEKNNELDVYFSKTCGEHSTFRIDKNNIVEKYGEDTSAYVNYFMSKLKNPKE